jgi:hypothetical protein
MATFSTQAKRAVRRSTKAATLAFALVAGCGGTQSAPQNDVDASNPMTMSTGGASASNAAGASANTPIDAGKHDAAPAATHDAGHDSGSAQQPVDAAVTHGDAGSAMQPFATDRGAFGLGGASLCEDAGFLLCDGFEGAQIDMATWTLDTWGAGSAAIDASRAARGKQSVHITEPSAVARVMLRETKTLAATGDHFFGRFFLYLTANIDPLQCNGECTNLVHWTAAAAGGKYMEGGQTYQPDVRAVGAVNQRLLLNLDGGPKAEVGIDDSNAPAGYTDLDASHVNQWMCFEFEYAGQGDAAEIRVWWDGLEHPGLHYDKDHVGDKGELWPIPKYDHIDFGFAHYQDYSAHFASFDTWLDEIAVDDARIGCGR